jgi:hypothetical protein
VAIKLFCCVLVLCRMYENKTVSRIDNKTIFVPCLRDIPAGLSVLGYNYLLRSHCTSLCFVQAQESMWSFICGNMLTSLTVIRCILCKWLSLAPALALARTPLPAVLSSQPLMAGSITSASLSAVRAWFLWLRTMGQEPCWSWSRIDNLLTL